MSDSTIRGAAAFVGAGLAGIGAAPGYSHLDLLGLAVHDALNDAGLELRDVDGLFTANMSNILPTLAVGEYLGLRPAVAVGTNNRRQFFRRPCAVGRVGAASESLFRCPHLLRQQSAHRQIIAARRPAL